MDISNVTNITEAQEEYVCGAGLDAFYTAYSHVHGYASLLVCIFGSIANTLNIIVLTRREMSSPTNAILTGLAVADLLVMLEYIPFASHMYLYQRSRQEMFTYGWTLLVLFHSLFGQVCHTISIWLTVTLAIWRYIAIAYPQRNREWCSFQRTIVAITGAYITCPIICIPLYLTTSVNSRVDQLDPDGRSINDSTYNSTLRNEMIESGNVTDVALYFVEFSETGRLLNLWIYSIVIKIIPCIALTILSLQLILALVEAKKRRKKLTTATVVKTDDKTVENCEIKKSKKKSSRLMDKERQTDRTTRMLLAVLMLFLITEFPQGVLGILCVMLGNGFMKTCYVKLGDVMDILALINSAINFILYCAMSRQFRMTFNQLFGRWKLLGRWMPVPQNGNHNGNTGTNHTVTQVTQV